MKIELSPDQLCFIREVLEYEIGQDKSFFEMESGDEIATSIVNEIESILTPEQIKNYNDKYW